MRPGLLERGVGGAGAEPGQEAVVVRGSRHVGVQPAAALGLKQCVGRGEQAGGALGLVLPDGDGGQRLEIVGQAWLVPGLGRQRQALPAAGPRRSGRSPRAWRLRARS